MTRDDARYFGWTRQFTGTARINRAYVRDRQTGRAVVGCPHRHRSNTSAKRCADKMVRGFQPREGKKWKE